MTRMRTRVDNWPSRPTSWHTAQAVQVVLMEGPDGEEVATAEVQVAKRGTDMAIVVAGLYGYTVNDRGHLVIHVSPSVGHASGPEDADEGQPAYPAWDTER